jgi:cyclic pyranopterin phosphate synthase
MDLTFIEVMPLGDVGEGRLDQYLPLSMVRARIAERFTLEDIDYRTSAITIDATIRHRRGRHRGAGAWGQGNRISKERQ